MREYGYFWGMGGVEKKDNACLFKSRSRYINFKTFFYSSNLTYVTIIKIIEKFCRE